MLPRMADLHCKRCHAVLPVTVSDDGNVLATQDGDTRYPFMLRCRSCDTRLYWQPQRLTPGRRKV